MSVVVKKIGNREYAYLAYRTGKRVVQKYLGPASDPAVRSRQARYEESRKVPERFDYLFWDIDSRKLDSGGTRDTLSSACLSWEASTRLNGYREFSRRASLSKHARRAGRYRRSPGTSGGSGSGGGMHTECLDQRAVAVLDKIRLVVDSRSFVLAGGTGAALHLGHRKSFDFGLFTGKHFSTDEIIRSIRKQAMSPVVLQEEKDTLTVSINNVKVSFFLYPYRFIEKTKLQSGVPVAGLIDIAGMKILAITQRGAKRDFVDLFYILQDVPFRKIAHNMVIRFGKERVSPVIMGKALVYFADAEPDPDPLYLGRKKEWKGIKQFFVGHVRQFVLDMDKALLDLKRIVKSV